MSQEQCADIDHKSFADVDASECPECVAIGSSWVHLRACVDCGHIGCCDSSPNRHARQHADIAGHPVIISAEPGERWCYCYTHDAYRAL